MRIKVPDSGLVKVGTGCRNRVNGVRCGDFNRYAADGRCPTCFRDELQKKLDNWTTDPLAPSPHPPIKSADAERMGLSWTVKKSAAACRFGPHMHAPDRKTGRCIGCKGDPHGPQRAKAREAGLPEYMSYFACNTCGGNIRHTSNNKCKTCNPHQKTPSVAFMEAFPNKVIDKETAKSFGLVVYRTGKPCRNGHRSWRYIKGGACKDCRDGIAPLSDEGITGEVKKALALMAELKSDTLTKEQAQRFGMSIFKTSSPCKYGHRSWRRVKGGACIECQKVKATSVEFDKSERLMREHPSMFLSYEDAVAGGYEVYRTADLTVCEHAAESGWRSVRTRTCIACLRNNTKSERMY